MNRRNSVAFLVGIAALALVAPFWTPGQAQQGMVAPPDAAPRFAVLDLVRVFDETVQIQDLNNMIKKRNGELNAEAEQRRKIIENKQTELTAFKQGTPDYETRRKELMRLNIEANVWLKSSEEETEQEKFDWTRIIYEKALRAAGELAQERGYAVVLQRFEFKPDDVQPSVQGLRRMIQERNVIWHAPEIDITMEVVRRMDAEYKAEGGLSPRPAGNEGAGKTSP